MSKENNENEILKDLYIDSLNLSRLLIRKSSKLKLNMNTIYQGGINNYSTKQYEIFKYVNNMNCSNIYNNIFEFKNISTKLAIFGTSL